MVEKATLRSSNRLMPTNDTTRQHSPGTTASAPTSQLGKTRDLHSTSLLKTRVNASAELVPRPSSSRVQLDDATSSRDEITRALATDHTGAAVADRAPANSELIGRVQKEILDMQKLSGDIRERKSPLSTSLLSLKPASDQYAYAKKLTFEKRTRLAKALDAIILGAKGPVDADVAVVLRESVRHAQYRTHRPEDRSSFHLKNYGGLVNIGATALVTPCVLKQTKAGIRQSRRNYFNSSTRPEQASAFNDSMKLLRSPNVSEKHKEFIAKTLLDQYIRREKIIAPANQKALIGFIEKELGRKFKADSIPKGTDEQERALHEAIIKFAGTRYSAKTAKLPAKKVEDCAQLHSELRPAGLEDLQNVGFENNVSKCPITFETLSVDDPASMPVVLMDPYDVPIGVYSLGGLAEWVNEEWPEDPSNPMAPRKQAGYAEAPQNEWVQLTGDTLKELARRIEPTPL